MLSVKEGEIQKLGLLYERYKKRLFGFFFQMNKDANLSEDLVQNVFVKILKSLLILECSTNFDQTLQIC